MTNNISSIISRLLNITKELQDIHEKTSRKFTLDGRLIGDIGEVLASEQYDITLLSSSTKDYDAKTTDGRMIQIKATMKDKLTFPVNKVPKYYLGIKIDENGDIVEIYNGPGKNIADILCNRKASSQNGLHAISINTLIRLNKDVRPEDRIPQKTR